MARDRTTDQVLEGLDLDLDLSSGEGVSLDYVSRIRVEFLLGQHAALQEQARFADTKAGLLIAVSALAWLIGAPRLSAEGPLLFTSAAILLLIAAATACGILVLLPRYADRAGRRAIRRKDVFSWTGVAADDWNGEDYARFMRTAEVSQLVLSLSFSNATVSGIVLRKFALTRTGWLIALGVVFAALVHAGLASGFAAASGTSDTFLR